MKLLHEGAAMAEAETIKKILAAKTTLARWIMIIGLKFQTKLIDW